MSPIQRFDGRIRCCLGAAVVAVGLAARVVAAQESAAPVVEYARDPGAVVVSFRETLGGVADPDPGPALSVYGDGRVRVHFPAYMKRRGDYELRLDEQAMHGLLRELVDRGVLTFDESAAREAKRAAAAARRAASPGGTLHAVSDVSWSVIEVSLERYRPPAGGPAVPATRRTIAWPDARSDAAIYPSIEAIRNLAAAEQTLRTLMERPDLTRVR